MPASAIFSFHVRRCGWPVLASITPSITYVRRAFA
jgi:ATP/ADP translocase